MRIYTLGRVLANTPSQQYARIVHIDKQPPFMEIYQYGEWVTACPGSQVWFTPVRVLPVNTEKTHYVTQN